jgi:hypothetical protein
VAGYREFQTGEVLTAANVNDFLMEQAVMTFADDAARTTALADVLREGLLTYNLDTGALERYDGTAWVPAAPETPGIGSNVVQVAKQDRFTTTSTSFVDVTDIEVTITPTSDTSKILLSFNGTVGNSNTFTIIYFRIDRDGSPLSDAISTASTNDSTAIMGYGGNNFDGPVSIMYLDDPATTSAVTYKIQARTTGGTLQVGGNATNGAINSLTAIEVAA